VHAHLCCPLTGRAEAGKPQLALCEAAAAATLRALAAKGARRQTKEKWSTICFKHQNDLLAFGAHFSLSLSCSRLPAQQPLARTHDPICIQRHTNKQHGPSSLSLSLSCPNSRAIIFATLDFKYSLYPPSMVAWACLMRAMEPWKLGSDQLQLASSTKVGPSFAFAENLASLCWNWLAGWPSGQTPRQPLYRKLNSM